MSRWQYVVLGWAIAVLFVAFAGYLLDRNGRLK